MNEQHSRMFSGYDVHSKDCVRYYEIAMVPRARGVTSTLAFVEQEVNRLLK